MISLNKNKNKTKNPTFASNKDRWLQTPFRLTCDETQNFFHSKPNKKTKT
jgi:hypothetical protein